MLFKHFLFTTLSLSLFFATPVFADAPPFLFTFGADFGVGNLASPRAITLDSQGNVYVLEAYGVKKFTALGVFITQWGSFGSGDGQFNNAVGIAHDSSDNIYVIDFYNKRVEVFDSGGAFIKKWIFQTSFEAVPPYSGIAVAPSGDVYLADYDDNRIQKFSNDGVLQNAWGSYGILNGQFKSPAGLGIDSDGNVYTSELGNNRVQKFTSSGEFIAKWGTTGSLEGRFNNPMGIAVDSAHNVYVTDRLNHRIQEFTSEGVFVQQWGSFGAGNSQFRFPTDIAVNNSGTIYVVDSLNNRVQVFGTLPVDPEPVCCSSVAFLPGLEGSRLYRKQVFENELWVPNRNDDARKLYLDETGHSIDPAIYTRDVIGSTFGTEVYKGFMASMNALVSSSTITEFKPLPYDWRLDINSIVDNPIKLGAGGSYSMVEKIEGLANASKTGKVSIVTHSNGGLVAKKLIQKLETLGKADLVDRLIMVAAPQLGSPKAIVALLHGFDQGLGIGGLNFLLSPTIARTFGENMPGAYTLLPSAEYFNQITDPVVIFDPSIDGINNLRTFYGNSITTASSLYDFLLATADGRTKPIESNLTDPNVLRSNLLMNATSTHEVIDYWTPPATLEVDQIAGWGIDTVKGVKYVAKEQIICQDKGQCQNVTFMDYEPLFTLDGDSTVVTPSAITSSGGLESYYLDLEAYNKGANTNRKHLDIMEALPTRELIDGLITGSILLPQYSAIIKPTTTIDKRLKIAIHSPVSVDLYDSFGKHTGLINNPDPNSDLQLIEENIPNSYYLEFGEGKYVGGDFSNIKTVKLAGTGSGTFTLNIELSTVGTTTTSNFVDIPVTPLLSGELSINATSSTAQLTLDVDGDGVDDFLLVPSASFDPILYLQIMRKMVLTFELKPVVEKQIIQKIDKLIKLIQNGKITKAGDKMKKYIKHIESGKVHKVKKLSETEKQTLLNMLNTLLDNLN